MLKINFPDKYKNLFEIKSFENTERDEVRFESTFCQIEPINLLVYSESTLAKDPERISECFKTYWIKKLKFIIEEIEKA